MKLSQLKFRAFDKKAQRETNFQICDNQVRFYDKHLGTWHIDDEGKRFVLTQFTGYHDKDGKEIYIGDIVEADNDGQKEYGEVKFGLFYFSACDEYPCCRTGLYADIPYFWNDKSIGLTPLDYADGIVKVVGNFEENKKDVLSVIKKELNNGN